MLKGVHLRQLVEIVFRGVPTVFEVCFMCLFMPLGRTQLQGSVSTNLLDTVRNQLDLRQVEVGIYLLGTIYLVADIFPPGVHFTPLLGWRTSFSISILVSHSLLHEFYSQGFVFGRRLFAGSPESGNIFECAKTMQGVFHVAQCCLIVRFILSIQIYVQQCLCALNCAIKYWTLSGASSL